MYRKGLILALILALFLPLAWTRTGQAFESSSRNQDGDLVLARVGTALIPVLDENTRHKELIPVTLVMELTDVKDLHRVCQRAPRLQEAAQIEFHRHRVTSNSTGGIDFSHTEQHLLTAFRGIARNHSVVRVLVIKGFPGGSSGVASRLPGGDPRNCSIIPGRLGSAEVD